MTTRKEMTPMEKLEWAAKTKEITDGYVLELFLNCEIQKAEDIDKAISILSENRPDLMASVVSAHRFIRQSRRESGCMGCKDCKTERKKLDQDKPAQ